jgi:serine protease Do
VVTEVNGQKVVNGSGLQMAISQMSPGASLKLGVIREGNPMNLSLTVGQYHAKGEEASNDNSGSHQKGKIGIAVANLDDQTRQQLSLPDQVKGVVVQEVRPGSPAEEAGLQPGDVIQEVNRKPAGDASQFTSTVHAAPADKDILLLVWSRGGASYRTVRPDQSVAQSDNNQ